MRRQKKRITKNIAIILTVSVLIWGTVQIKGSAGQLLKRAGMIAAILTMPEGGLMSLEDAMAPERHVPTQQISSVAPPKPYNPEDASSDEESNAPLEPLPPDEPSPNIPDKYKGRVIAKNMSNKDNKKMVPYKNARINNYTSMTPERIAQKLEPVNSVKLTNTTKPQVLIMHTHATESYTPGTGKYYDKRYNWRSSDNNSNMVAVGAALAKELEAAGIGVIHDTTQHDYPSYNGAYERSEETVKAYLKKYPTIKVVFDIHRDAIEQGDNEIVKPVVNINGKDAAQMMIIACVDDGKIGIPNWEQNFRFAANLNDHIETVYPELTRPIFLSYRKYNQHLTTGSLLLEFGTHASSLEEAKYSAELVGKAVASFFKE